MRSFSRVLPQRDDAADHDGRRAQRGEQLRGGEARYARHDVEPEPDDDEEGPLHHQRRQHRARGCRCAGVRRRQPEVQREERGLGEQSDRHQRRGDEGRRVCPDPVRQQDDVERAVSAVEQCGADQVEHRAEQREQQVAESGRERLGPAVQADQRHRGEGQQLERDVQREEIPGQEDRVQGAGNREQQDPERERRSRLDRPLGDSETPRARTRRRRRSRPP